MMFGKPTSGQYSASNDLVREVMEYAGDAGSIKDLVERQEFANAVNRMAARDFRDLVREAVKARFHPKTYSEIEYATGISTRHNVLVDAIDKVNAAVWPSARTWVERRGDDGTWSEDEDPRWAAYIAACTVDSVANRASWLRLAHPGVYLWPYVVEDERTGMRAFKTRVLTPEHFDVEACDDDATTWEAVSILGDHHDKLSGQRIFTRKRWDATSVSKWHRRAGDTVWTLDDVKPNPYGVVPGAFLQGEPDRLWGGCFGPPLYEATIAANVAQSYATLNSNAQVKMLAGVFDDMPQRQRIVHGGVLSTGAAGGELQQMLDFQLDNAGFRDAFITSERRSMAVMMGLPSDEFETTTLPPSGESLRLRYMGRQHMAERFREPVKAAVREWLETGLAVLAYEVLRAPDDDGEPLLPVAGFEDAASLPPYADGVPWSRQPFRFRIDVRDLQYPETQDERQKRIDYDLAHGFTTEAHEYKQENPDTLDAAAEIAQNKAANASTARISAPRPMGITTPAIAAQQARRTNG